MSIDGLLHLHRFEYDHKFTRRNDITHLDGYLDDVALHRGFDCISRCRRLLLLATALRCSCAAVIAAHRKSGHRHLKAASVNFYDKHFTRCRNSWLAAAACVGRNLVGELCFNPTSVNGESSGRISRCEGGVARHNAMECQRSRDAIHLELRQCPAGPLKGLLASCSGHDEFRQQGIEVATDDIPSRKARVNADAGTCWEFPGC